MYLIQYWLDTTGIQLMVKYLFNWSKAAEAPPRLQLTMQAPGLPWDMALLP